MSVIIVTGADEGIGYSSSMSIAATYELPLRFVAFPPLCDIDSCLQQRRHRTGTEARFGRCAGESTRSSRVMA